MYSLDVFAVAVATGNVLFFHKNTEKKTHAWRVSSCPGASGALFPASCLATSHLSPPFAPSACLWFGQAGRCAVTDLEHVLICQLAAISELSQTQERGAEFPSAHPLLFCWGVFPLHICTIWNPLQLTKPSLLNMEKLGVTKMPMVGTVYCVWIWDLIILFKNEAVVVLHIDWWDLLWFDLYFYIVLKICGTTTMFVEKQACPDQEAFFNVFGDIIVSDCKKTFCSNRAVWFPPKENCSRGSLNRNYYLSSMSAFTLKAADVFAESQNYLSWKRPERSPRCNFLQQIKYY